MSIYCTAEGSSACSRSLSSLQYGAQAAARLALQTPPPYLQFCFQAQASNEWISDVVVAFKAQCTLLLHDTNKHTMTIANKTLLFPFQRRFKNFKNQAGTLPDVGVSIIIRYLSCSRETFASPPGRQFGILGPKLV